MSEALEIIEEMEIKITALQESCVHPDDMIKTWEDLSSIGRGSLYPMRYICCTNCGKKKIVKDLPSNKPFVITLDKQEGLYEGAHEVFTYFNFSPSYLYQLKDRD